jgi:peptidoglycan/xylan/chitin deacetylase (PgdA/CDA1 family)
MPTIQIVQCWDDGVIDDLRLTELLRAHNAQATFNLNPGMHGTSRGHTWTYKGVKEVYRLARSELLAAYDGFTIANHSVNHPWPAKIPLEEWRREVEDGRKQLQDMFQQPILGFAYPYGQYEPAPIIEVVRAAGHTYARTCENATPCHPAPDPLAQPTDCHFAASDFWARYERAKALASPVFYFWGHSYELVTEEDWSAFAAKLARFNADPDAVWADLPSALARSPSL